MHTPPDNSCANCGTPLAGEYCGACGQRRFTPDSLTLRRFVRDAAKEFTSVDGRFLRSLGPLLFRPGLLTAEYLAGRQRRFVKPVTLFVFVNIFFFFFGYRLGLMRWSMEYPYGEAGRAMITERAERLGMEREAYLKRLDGVMSDALRSLFFGVIPLFAAVSTVALFRRRRRYIEHLVYSVHFHSSYLVVFPVTAVVVILITKTFDAAAGTAWADVIGRDPGIAYLAMGMMWMYHAIALRRVFGGGRLRSAAEGAVLTLSGTLIMVPVGQKALFWFVWFTAA